MPVDWNLIGGRLVKLPAAEPDSGMEETEGLEDDTARLVCGVASDLE